MSIYGDILTSVQAVIQGLPGVVDCKVRKYPLYLKEHDTLPLVLIVPGTEDPEQLQFDNSAIYRYPVQVVYVQESRFLPEDVTTILDFRERCRLALHKTTLSGAATVFDCDYNPAPPFSETALQSGLDVSSQEFIYRSQEPRSS